MLQVMSKIKRTIEVFFVKKSLLLILITFSVSNIISQEKGKFRGGLDFDLALPDNGVGLGYDFNLGYNISNNVNLGIKWSSVSMLQAADYNVSGAKIKSFTGNFSYYFNDGSSNFAPFVGFGLGHYRIFRATVGNSISGGVDGKLGGLINVGFDLSKFRMGLEYNLIPKTTYTSVEIVDFYTGEIRNIGTLLVPNSYMSIKIGFYLGGGKWKKPLSAKKEVQSTITNTDIQPKVIKIDPTSNVQPVDMSQLKIGDVVTVKQVLNVKGENKEVQISQAKIIEIREVDVVVKYKFGGKDYIKEVPKNQVFKSTF